MAILKEIPLQNSFDIDITGRCNYRCKFCLQRDRLTAQDMAFGEFKRIIDQIVELSKSKKIRMGRGKKTLMLKGKSFGVVIAGGEPFLNAQAVEMIAYSVKHLGRKNVEVVTNLSRFPTSAKEAMALLKRMGLPKVTISIDPEHLRYGKSMAAKVSTFLAASQKLGIKVGLTNVALNKRQQKNPWPKSMLKVIPEEKRARADFRLDQYAHPSIGILKNFLQELAKGKGESSRGGYSYRIQEFLPIQGLSEMQIPQRIAFAPDGRAYIQRHADALYFPQLSIGNWKKESLQDILGKNLPFKMELLRPWFGFWRTGGRNTARKAELFATQALRKFERQRKERRGR